jgi:hypothetical protein
MEREVDQSRCERRHGRSPAAGGRSRARPAPALFAGILTVGVLIGPFLASPVLLAGCSPVRQEPTHVIFVFVDHWEPGSGPGASELARHWLDEYVPMARLHPDADGRFPQHTWFCRSLDPESLRIISRCVFAGCGEMEIHIHHGSSNDDGRDNTADMSGSIDQYVEELQTTGACLTAEAVPKSAWAFIHGNWALDNSRFIDGHRQYCGVNRELDLLLSKGCYGDFTFPAWGPMTPLTWTSTLYAATDTPLPKSYDDPLSIRPLSAGAAALRPDELPLLVGPGPDARISNIDSACPPTLERMREWVGYYVHVPGRDHWVFVKVYTHSAASLKTLEGRSNLLGATADRFYADLERHFNDGTEYVLHYATAREMYNMVAAAVDGHGGSPDDYREYRIASPANRFFFSEARFRLLSLDRVARLALLQFENTAPPLVLLANTFDPADTVYESDAASGPFSPSDASLSSTPEVPLVITDDTPSRYYRIGP